MPKDWMFTAVALHDKGMTQKQVAEQLGKKLGTVSEFLYRYSKLIPESRNAFWDGKLGSRRTMALGFLDKEEQKRLLFQILGKGNEERYLDESARQLCEKIENLKAEKKVLEREVKRLRAPSLFASKLRKLVLELEKEEAEVAELASQVDLKDYYLEAQRWRDVFQRYERYVKDALDGRKVVVLDVKANNSHTSCGSVD